MKKIIIMRGLLGIPIGISIGYIITIIIFLGWGGGEYYPCAPELVEQFGSEVSAIIIQAVLCALYGAICSASSVIWEIDKWSLAKQSGIFFGILSITTIPIAYFANWMEHSFKGFLIYFGIFLCVFMITWLIQYCVWKNKINKIEEKMKNRE